MKIINDNISILNYCEDASNFNGNADIVYIPNNLSDLKFIVKELYSNSIPFTLSGARTGLVGASVPLNGAVLSLENMNKILEINTDKNYCIVEPGVTQAQLANELNKYDFFYPVNPTERNSTIGGNFSTNASGSRTFKYGQTRSHVLSAKILLSNSDEIYCHRDERFHSNGVFEIKSENGTLYKIPIVPVKIPPVKSVAGYYITEKSDILDLFIGSEGTLGIATEIKLIIIPKPSNILGLICFFDILEKLFDFVDFVKRKSRENNLIDYKICNDISARLIEFFDFNSLQLLKNKYHNIPVHAQAAIWLEQEYSLENENTLLEQWFDLICQYSNLAEETWTATNDEQHKQFTDFRHALPLQVYEIITKNNQIKINPDIAVPDEYCKYFYYEQKKLLEKYGLAHVIFGHIGNNHFHVNVFANNSDELKLAYKFYDEVISEAISINGSIAAEHGIGKIKNKYMQLYYSPDTIEYFKTVKQILDPKLLLGRGTLLTIE